MMELSVGDVVMLNSGGPAMTVKSIGKMYEDDADMSAWCTWFLNDREPKTEVFPVKALTKQDT